MLRRLVVALALLTVLSATIQYVGATSSGAKSPEQRKRIKRNNHNKSDKRPGDRSRTKMDNAGLSQSWRYRLREAHKRPLDRPASLNHHKDRKVRRVAFKEYGFPLSARGSRRKRRAAKHGRSAVERSIKLPALQRSLRRDRHGPQPSKPSKGHNKWTGSRQQRHLARRRGGDPAQHYVGLDRASAINVTSANLFQYNKLARKLLRRVKKVNYQRRKVKARDLPAGPLIEEETALVRLRKAINRYYKSNPTARHPTRCVCDHHYRDRRKKPRGKSHTSKAGGGKAHFTTGTTRAYTRSGNTSSVSAVVSLVRHRTLDSNPIYRHGQSVGSPVSRSAAELPSATIVRAKGRRIIAEDQSIDETKETPRRSKKLADANIGHSWAGLGAIQVPERELPHVIEVPGVRPPGLQYQPIYEQLGAVVAYCTLAFVLVATLGMAGILSNIRLRKQIGEAAAGSRLSIAPEDGIQLKIHVRRDSIQALPI